MEEKPKIMPHFDDCIDILNIIRYCDAEFVESVYTFKGDTALVETKNGDQYFVHVIKNPKSLKINYPPHFKPFKKKEDMSTAERLEFFNSLFK